MFNPEIKIHAHIDRANRAVTLETENLAGQIVRRVIETEDAFVRRALIELGWAPPEDVNRLGAALALYKQARTESDDGLGTRRDTLDGLLDAADRLTKEHTT